MSLDLPQVTEAIRATREGLDAAGFDVTCTDDAGRLVLTLQARADACEECLVPKAIFLSIVRQELADGGVGVTDVDVIYPVEVSDDAA